MNIPTEPVSDTGDDSSPQRPLVMPAIQEEAGSGEGENSEEISQSGSAEASDSHEEVWTGDPTCQEMNRDMNKTEMVVTPLLIVKPKPHRPPDSIWTINHDVSERYSSLMKNFSKLMVAVHEELVGKSVPVQPFSVYLMGIKSNMKFGIGSKKETKLSDVKNWTEMFDYLSDIKAWDCLNYELLRNIVQEHLQDSETLENQLRLYDIDTMKFIETTLLLDFLDIYKELFPDDSEYRKGCAMLKVKLPGHLPTMTLSEFHSTQGYLTCQFRLQHYVLRLAVANDGCVIVFWYVPQCLVACIQDTCKLLQPDFGQAGVIELCIGDSVLYQARNIEDIVQNGEIEPASDVMSEYDKLLAESIEKPQEFWFRMAAKTLRWKELCTKENILSQSKMEEGKIHWFDGKLNASVNCLDRHAASAPNKVAIIWEKNDGTSEKFSYQKLLGMTCQIAHVLKNKGVKKGDVVLIYMPSSPITVSAMFACTRIGAIHCVVYAVLKNNELEARIKDANAKIIITCDVATIGDKPYSLKDNVDKALRSMKVRNIGSRCWSTRSLDQVCKSDKLNKPTLEFQRSLSSGAESLENDENFNPTKKPKPQFVVLVSQSGSKHRNDEQDFILEEEMRKFPTTFEPEYVEAEHTMFIMYTSGTSSAATPTGIKHCTAGYLLYVALTHQYVFDYKLGDVFGCMADLGWITGHSYVVYGPLCNGATTVLFEGTATYPKDDRYWKAISDHKINQLYVTPYVISQLMRLPGVPEHAEKYDRSSLKTIATVGEPLSGHVLDWFRKFIGHNSCKFVDTWWQTELGGIALIVDHDLKDLPDGNFPAKPFFGVDPVIIDPKLKGIIPGKNMAEPGYLCLRKPLPGMGRGVTDLCKKNFEEMYFQYKGHGFFTQDLALRLNGGYRITGRLNNAIRIQGSWLDVASIENQMNASDERIVKTALIGIPDRNVSTERYDYEGACILLECSSEDQTVRDEVCSKVMDTVKKGNLLPDETTNGIFPGIVVFFISKWLSTPSGKTIIHLYQNLVDVASQIWLCKGDSSMTFASFFEHHMSNLSNPLP